MSNGTRLIAVIVVVVLAAIGLYYAFLYNPNGTKAVPIPVNTNITPGSVTPPAPSAGGLGSTTSGVAGGEATRPVTPPSGAFGPPTGAAANTGASTGGTGTGGIGTGSGGPVPVGSTPSTGSAPASTRAPSNTAAVSATEYTIQKGDTFEALARKFFNDGSKASLIQAANPGVDPKSLAIGQKIKIPAGTSTASTGSKATPVETAASGNTYTVQERDTLSSIARKVYGSDSGWQRILEANSALLKGNPQALKAGMKLTIPPKR